MPSNTLIRIKTEIKLLVYWIEWESRQSRLNEPSNSKKYRLKNRCFVFLFPFFFISNWRKLRLSDQLRCGLRFIYFILSFSNLVVSNCRSYKNTQLIIHFSVLLSIVVCRRRYHYVRNYTHQRPPHGKYISWSVLCLNFWFLFKFYKRISSAHVKALAENSWIHNNNEKRGKNCHLYFYKDFRF